MSSFSEVVNAKLNEARLPKSCKLIQLRQGMNQEDTDALDYAIAAVREEQLSIAWLVGVLNNNGFQIGKTVVSDHLSGRCACDASE